MYMYDNNKPTAKKKKKKKKKKNLFNIIKMFASPNK